MEGGRYRGGEFFNSCVLVFGEFFDSDFDARTVYLILCHPRKF